MEIGLEKSRSLSLDGFTLKMIAILAMVIDHVGYLFMDNFLVFRIIGRLTIPIMAFFITEGYRKTSNVNRYMLRLAIFAVLSMVPYYLAFHGSFFNILFNLLLGLIAIHITSKLTGEWQRWGVVVLLASAAYFLNMDGMYTVVPLIYLMNKYRDSFKKMFAAVACLLTGISVFQVVCSFTPIAGSFPVTIYTWIRPCALISLLLLYGYNGQRGRSIKYLFYTFYPAHLLVLYLISRFL